MSKVLVTGGKGFLGSHLVARLRERGDEVYIFARANGEEPSEDCVVWGDIRDTQAVSKAVQGMDAVIHTVSNFRRGGSDKDEAYSVNVDGTKNVVQAALKHGVGRLVHCSTIGVHGSVKEIPANEETPFNPGDLYQETKLAAELYVRETARETGLPVSIVRPISLFGPGDERMLKLFSMIQKGVFVTVGDGKALFQPAYIDDVVDGFMLALDHEEALGETFIIGGDEYVPLNELVRIIADLLGVDPPRWKVPMAPVLLAARLTEAVFVPLGLEPPLHMRRVSFFQNNRAFSIDKARNVLGFEPQVGLREGLRRTINWYKKQGWL